MRRFAAILLLGAGCATAPSSNAPASGPAESPSPAGGRSVAELSLETYPQPGRHAFAADRGQLVVIDAWATWCAPCVRSLPLLQKLARDYGPRGVRVYAVSIDENRAEIPSFLAKHPIELPILLDPGASALEQKLGLRGMPTTWVVDRTGQVRYTQEMAEDDLKDLRDHLDGLLKAP